MKEMETNNIKVQTAYQAINQHWSHAEQERWSILYNFLMASTILLLAWATIFGSISGTEPSTIKRVILALLSVGGIVISGLWITIGCRVNKFIKRYGELGERVEGCLGIKEIGPFKCGEDIRKEEKRREKRQETKKDIYYYMEWIGSRIPSRYFVVIIPSIFLIIYLVLFTLSLLS